MKKAVSTGAKTCILAFVFVLVFSFASFAQKKTPSVKPTPNVNLPKVTQIDEVGLKTALKPNGKPLLVNFWATWCDPCREEFPDLVKLDAEYKGKIDFITISLDDLAEIRRDVPKFLAGMKAEMPAYLLKVADESAVISSIAKDWNGGLPFTILYNEKGEIAYFIQGKVKMDAVKVEIDKLAAKPVQTTAFEKGKEEAQKDLTNGILSFKTNKPGRRIKVAINQIKENYAITVEYPKYSTSSQTTNNPFKEVFEFMNGYNSVSEIEIEKKFGETVINEIKRQFAPELLFANVDELTLTVNRKP